MAFTFETRNRRHLGSCPNESTEPIRSYSGAMPANSRRAWRVRSGSMARDYRDGQVSGNGDCHHHGVELASIRSTHFTHQNPRLPGATSLAGNP